MTLRTPVIIFRSLSRSSTSLAFGPAGPSSDTIDLGQTCDMSSEQKVVERAVRIPSAGIALDGDLAVPAEEARGVVLFAHGSGSGRHSPRNRRVAGALQEIGWATLLLDLLTPEEEQIDLRTRELRFDISRLAARLTAAADWLAEQSDTAELPLAVFGASTGAAAALVTPS